MRLDPLSSERRQVRAGGYGIITVEGQSFSLSEQLFGSEFLPDPVLLTQRTMQRLSYAGCIAGSSCLESDMLTWRKINFPTNPEAGDIIAYINTAGYQMDANESPFHRSPLPDKVAVWQQNDHYQWCLDRLFHNAVTHSLAG